MFQTSFSQSTTLPLLNAKGVLAVMVATLFSGQALAEAAGRVTFISGDVVAISSDGNRRAIRDGRRNAHVDLAGGRVADRGRHQAAPRRHQVRQRCGARSFRAQGRTRQAGAAPRRLTPRTTGKASPAGRFGLRLDFYCLPTAVRQALCNAYFLQHKLR